MTPESYLFWTRISTNINSYNKLRHKESFTSTSINCCCFWYTIYLHILHFLFTHILKV